MLATLFWVFSLIIAVSYLVKLYKRNIWIKKTVTAILKKNAKNYLLFDEEQLTYSSDDYKSEIKWTYFSAYLEDTISIYIFPQGSVFSCHSFSAFEIGQDNLQQLKQIVRTKLPMLKIKKDK